MINDFECEAADREDQIYYDFSDLVDDIDNEVTDLEDSLEYMREELEAPDEEEEE